MGFLGKLFKASTKPESQDKKKTASSLKKPVDKKPSTCPYCSSVFEKSPSRKAKCPSCSKFVFVRKGKLLTEEQKCVYDWIKKLEPFGVSKNVYEKHREDLQQQFNGLPRVNDVVWRILNSLTTTRKDLNELVFIYEEMAHLVKDEGKDATTYFAQVKKLQDRLNRQSLKKMKDIEEMITGVEILAVIDSHTCEYCRAMHGRKFSLEEAIKEMPVPGKCSSLSRCRCSLLPVFRGDK